MSVIVVNHVSLDGVLQGPGRPDEDTRDGFAHGGRAQPANDPAMAEVMGSGQLVRSLLPAPCSLLPHGLVDEVLLFIHPVVLGSGRRLFGPDDQARQLRLVDTTATDTGVLIATYEAQPASHAAPAGLTGRP